MKYIIRIILKKSTVRSGLTIDTIFLVLIATLFFCSCATMNDGWNDERNDERNDRNRDWSNRNMPSEPGKCYAKCLMQDAYETFEEELLVYTGKDFNSDGIELEKIVFRPKSSNWEKKRADNCRSRDPNDCLVWCMVETPEVSNEYYVVTDTNMVKEFKREIVTYREVVNSGGYTEWREVICENDVTKSLIMRLQLALIEEGHIEVIPDGKTGPTTREALVRFQKGNGLPVGSLDLETLNMLGVEY